MDLKTINAIAERNARIKNMISEREWYDIRHLMSYDWAFFYILLGARCTGKSYSIMDYCLNQYKKHGTVFYWMRLNEASTKNMLANNAQKFVDPDLVRKYNLQITQKAGTVYDHGKIMCHVMPLSTAANFKGSAFFDKDYMGNYNIVLDEFQLEKDQKRCFDVCYNFVVQLENIVRMRKDGIKIFMIANSTAECSDILAMFNFIPEEWGLYKLKNKKCIIENIPNTDAYERNRKGTVGDILAGNTSNYTNLIDCDKSLVYKGRLNSPQYIIKFSKQECDWFTVWDGCVVAPYNKEKKASGIAMKRYINEVFNPEQRDNIFYINDARAFKFKDLITQKKFNYQLSLIKKM